MSLPAGNEAGVPAAYAANPTWVADPAYAGGGYWAAYGRGQHFDQAQLEQLWTDAGGSSSLAPLMAAIAANESGGDAGDWNSTGATGLWQIEYPGSAPAGITREQLFAPAENAAAAVELSGNTLAGVRSNWAGDAALSGAPPGRSSAAPTSGGGLSGLVSSLNPLSGLSSIGTTITDVAVIGPVVLLGGGLIVAGFIKATGLRAKAENAASEIKGTAGSAALLAA